MHCAILSVSMGANLYSMFNNSQNGMPLAMNGVQYDGVREIIFQLLHPSLQPFISQMLGEILNLRGMLTLEAYIV